MPTVLFTGTYEHTIDAKSRLAIPADIRARWDAQKDGSAWYALPWDKGLIRLYTEADFQKRAEGAELTLTPDEDEAELQATLFGMAARIEPDSAGRIRLPEDMLRFTGLGAEVVLVGARDRLELRDRNEWKASLEDRLSQMKELVSRISAKKRTTANGQ
ncbi:MAG: division/cell wall cluster transcriptional repressor MraZ [Phycisphaerales bacterium]